MDNASNDLIPTVSRRHEDHIIELLYDENTRRTALADYRGGVCTIVDRVALPTGEILVPYSARNSLIQHRCVLLPSMPVAHGGKDMLLADIEGYLHRYVDLPPAFERIAAYYALLSWVFDAFNELPYLRFQGDYGSGKTRALLALGSVVYKGFFASAASTVSPIFHTLNTFGGTLLLDEADLRFSDKTADLVKILNNGNVKGLPVLRTLQNRHREFNPAAFDVFGPKLLAMRGRFSDEALESRFLSERMGERPLRSGIPIALPSTMREEALALRNRLLDFRLTQLTSIQSDAERVIADVDPRLNQVALPLLSLVDDVQARDQIEARIRQQQRRLTAARERTLEARVSRSLAEMFTNSAARQLPLRALADRVNMLGAGDGITVSVRDIGQVLRARSVVLHKSNGTIMVVRPATPVAARLKP